MSGQSPAHTSLKYNRHIFSAAYSLVRHASTDKICNSRNMLNSEKSPASARYWQGETFLSWGGCLMMFHGRYDDTALLFPVLVATNLHQKIKCYKMNNRWADPPECLGRLQIGQFLRYWGKTGVDLTIHHVSGTGQEYSCIRFRFKREARELWQM